MIDGVREATPEAGVELPGGRQPSRGIPRFEHQHPLPFTGKQRGAYQAVVARADNKGVVLDQYIARYSSNG